MIGLGKLKCFVLVQLCCALIPIVNAAETPANLQCDVTNTDGVDDTYIIKVYLSAKKIDYRGKVYTQEGEQFCLENGKCTGAVEKIFAWDEHEITWGRIGSDREMYPYHWTLNRLSGEVTMAFISDTTYTVYHKGKCRKVDIVKPVI